jgi:apolipoprotein N-acyltransferase
MQLLPFMDMISRFLIPVFFEAVCITAAVVIYFLHIHKLTKPIIFQFFVIVLGSIFLSFVIKSSIVPKNQQAGLECTIIQGGYSAGDYNLINKYPVLAGHLIQRYLGYVRDVKNARFTILPESAFLVNQKKDGEIIQSLKAIAYSKNEYILTSMLLEEDTVVYNAVALINPQGEVQDIYKKRNVMLFVESSNFEKGTTLQTLMVDNYKVAPLICFDAVFIRNYFRDKPPDVFIVTSNDVFAEKTILSRLHQAYAVINSRTMGIPLLQVIQNGPSFFVNSKGELHTIAGPYERAVGLSIVLN